MSDWEFLHDMHSQGCSPEEIMDAASCGASPSDLAYIERHEMKEKWEELKSLRDDGTISPEEFKRRKAELFG